MIGKYIPGSGPLGAKLMILNEAPDSKSVEAGRTIPSRELISVLNEAGINHNNCWFSNVSKYYVRPNKTGKKIPFVKRALMDYDESFIPKQLDQLQNEINSLKPNCILGLSSSALWALSGKTNIGAFRGSIMHARGVKCVNTYDPDGLGWHSERSPEFKGYWNRAIIVLDCKRALQESLSSTLELPYRRLEVCQSYIQFYEFYHRYKNEFKVSVDIESGGQCIPVCIGFAFNKTHGMTVPLWNSDNISKIPDSDLVRIWLLIQHILTYHGLIGQNLGLYDVDKLRMIGFKLSNIVEDTMMKALAINPELPKGLAFNTSIFTREPYYKDEGMYQGSYEDLFIGCARDCCVTYEVAENMQADVDELGVDSFYRNFLMQLPELYNEIQNQGFTVDTVKRDALLRKYINWSEKLRYEMYSLVGADVNVDSPKQVKVLLFENFRLPYKDSTGEEAITELLNSPKVKDTNHRRVLELITLRRRVEKSIGTYMMALPDFDGKMRTTYFPALDTGRTSTGQQDPPSRPSIEVTDKNGKKKSKSLGIAFQTMTKHGDVGADIRAQYIPDNEDEEFVSVDSAQAEARVIFLLADDEQALKDIDNRDYHALTASWFFGGTENDYSKKVLGYEHPIRFVGKTLRHAGHLGAGKRRAAISVNTDARKFNIPITITEMQSERALKIFHTKQPKIQQIFQAQVVECLKRSRSLIAPLPYGVDAKIGGRRTFYERWGEELNRMAFSYIPQRAVSDNTKAAALRIRERCKGIKLIMESHDGLLYCVPKIKLDEWLPIIKEEMERPIDFSRCSLPRRELIIPCEIETGSNYENLSKYRGPIKLESAKQIELIPKTVSEKFYVTELPKDTELDNHIYNAMERKL